MTSNPLWYLTRGSGVVSLLLLTATTVLGVATSNRAGGRRCPRFVVAGLHRNLSLLGLLFIAVHVVTTVADGYAPITLLDAVVPFRSAYRPLWLGFGALALDLLLCVALSSLLRRHIGLRAWRTLHWLAYAAWPVAVIHGLGTGSDAATRWLQALTAMAVAAVVCALLWRLARDWRDRSGLRAAAAVTTLALPFVGGAWYRSGPLEPGWAASSGTPRALLGAVRGSRAGLPAAPFTAAVAGSLTPGATAADGTATVVVDAVAGDGLDAAVRVWLAGRPVADGSLQVSSGRVQLGTRAAPDLYAGAIGGLDGGRIEATVRGAAAPPALAVSVDLRADESGRTVSGTLRVRPATVTGP